MSKLPKLLLLKLVVLAFLAYATVTTNTQSASTCQLCVQTDQGDYGCAIDVCRGYRNCIPLEHSCNVSGAGCRAQGICWPLEP
jgi:hypothetical protein